ncbi:MAG: hypothetical protein ACK554_03540 [Erythrobacteraceae bacterium]
MKKSLILCAALAVLVSSPAAADWNFNGQPNPNAFIQTGNLTLELQCDRVRFAPAGYEDSQEIVSEQGLSFRFMKNGSTEVGAFQAGAANSSIRIADNYPVEIVFSDRADYDFVLDQMSENAALNLSKVDQNISYGIFDLKGSGAAINALRSACGSVKMAGAVTTTTMKAPEGVVYCGGGAVKRQIEFVILDKPEGQWDARVTVNGETIRAMTAYSYFGTNQQPPKGFVVALLTENRNEFLVFRDGDQAWLEFGDYQYNKCN